MRSRAARGSLEGRRAARASAPRRVPSFASRFAPSRCLRRPSTRASGAPREWSSGNPPPRAVDSRGRPVIIITIIIPSRTRRDCGVGSRTTPSTSPPPRCATAPRRARPRPRPPGSIPRSGAVSASRARSTTRDRDRPRGVSSRRARGARLPRAAWATLAAAAPRGGPRFPRAPRFRPAPRVRRSRVASHAPRVTGALPRAPPNPLARHPPEEEASISPISPTRGSRRG